MDDDEKRIGSRKWFARQLKKMQAELDEQRHLLARQDDSFWNKKSDIRAWHACNEAHAQAYLRDAIEPRRDYIDDPVIRCALAGMEVASSLGLETARKLLWKAVQDICDENDRMIDKATTKEEHRERLEQPASLGARGRQDRGASAGD